MGCAALRPNPQSWTRKEKTAAGFFILAHLANAYSAKRISDDPCCYEANPFIDGEPSGGEIAVYCSITGFGALILSHYYPKLRVPLLMTYGGINVGLTLYDLSILGNDCRYKPQAVEIP